MKHLTTIPFSGFYESLHDGELDDTLRQMFSDRDTGCHVNENLLYAAMDKIDWRAVHTEYASEYCDCFAHWLELELTFDELQSPREYNFTTDRIFAYITTESLQKAFDRVDTPALRTLVREQFTSRDGFMSFYSGDLDDWPENVLGWDHNQIGALLHALADQESRDSDGFTQWEEYALMEDTRCNGGLDSMLCTHMANANRLFKIHDYLELRAHREGTQYEATTSTV